MFLLLFGVAQAAVLTVRADSKGDHSTIQSAVDAAVDGDVVVVGPGTWRESVDLGAKTITLRGAVGARATVLDPGGLPAFAMRAVGGASTVADFTIRNPGRQGVRCSDGALALQDVVLEGLGSSGVDGGAVRLVNCTLTAQGALFRRNRASRGGHIFATLGSSVQLVDTVLAAGDASESGGAVHLGEGTTLTAADSRFEDNLARVHGGAIYAADLTQVELTRVDVTDNAVTGEESDHGGGGLWLEDAVLLTASQGAWTGNDCIDSEYRGEGGALRAGEYGDVTLDQLEISGNSCYSGGGAYIVGDTTDELETTVVMQDLVVTSNTAAEEAGGILISNVDSVLERLWFSNNHALSGNVGSLGHGRGRSQWTDISIEQSSAEHGGGLFIRLATIQVDGLTVSDCNATAGYGGGIFLEADADMSGLELRNNTALLGGGGLWVDDPTGSSEANVVIVGAVFEDNSAAWGGGVAIEQADTFWLSDFVATGNTATTAGGFLYDGSSDISLAAGEVTGNSAPTGGGLSFDEYGWGTISHLLLDGNEATDGNGGGLQFISEREDYDLSIEDSVFIDNTASEHGGGAYIRTAAAVVITDTDFQGNAAGEAFSGGGLHLRGADGGATMTGLDVCGNTADSGGGLYATGLTGGLSLTGSILQANHASTQGGGASLTGSSAVSMVNNTIVDNGSDATGGGLYLASEDVDLTNNVIAWTTGGVGVWATTDVGWNLAHNDWYDNLGIDISGAYDPPDLDDHPGQLFEDPSFVAHAGACDDDLQHTSGSPLVDAGDPAIRDLDGSTSDIGAYGGTSPQSTATDADGDLYDTDADCDDTDPSVHPDARDVWYDGVDADCDGASDHDADGDGYDSDDHGGTDCDDRNPGVRPGIFDFPGDGFDRNCDGVD